jgi:hypothetical protein
LGFKPTQRIESNVGKRRLALAQPEEIGNPIAAEVIFGARTTSIPGARVSGSLAIRITRAPARSLLFTVSSRVEVISTGKASEPEGAR